MRKLICSAAAAMLSASILALPSIVQITYAEPTTRESVSQPPAVGDPAPAMALQTLAGEEVQLAELRKKGPVVLIVLRGWVGYQCPVCTKQVGDFVAHVQELEKAGAQVVLVYPGSAEKLKQHAEDFEKGKQIPASFSFVTDPDLKFTRDWGLRWNTKGETAYPSTFIIDREGIVRFAKISHSHGDRANASETLKALAEASKS
jgi:peroxiredoxin